MSTPNTQPNMTDVCLMRSSAGLFPAEVKLWTNLIITAYTNNHGGAIRVWSLSRSLDQDGSGTVNKNLLFKYLSHLGVHERTIRRWIESAVNLGLLIPYYRTHSKNSGYRISSVVKTAVSIGCTHIGNRPVKISAKNLVSAGWRSYVWGGEVSKHNGRPISRNQLKTVTGLSKTTQIRYEKKIKITRKPNFLITNQPASNIHGFKEFYKRHAFIFTVKKNNKTVLAWRLPDSVYVNPDIAIPLKKGSTKKHNKQLNHLILSTNLSNVGQAQSETTNKEIFCKLFFTDDKSARQNLKKLGRQKYTERLPKEVFVSMNPNELFKSRTKITSGFWTLKNLNGQN